ncbi:hypothetical protein QYE76_068174 [Lolium multiflorum]|uniref:Transposase MuDR plant domain-containing protein n=1 Tax=Lolium multiflorum TaxID=4521 RepID=A0AAD8SE89_LOLMU|nr:hypothetical protein QYE76_068174 [Lolium multiflorum]
MGTGSRVTREVEPEYIDDEERLYSDVVQNLRRPCRAENRDESDNEAFVIDDEEVEDEDLPTIEWDPANPQMEEGTICASMSECRNALVTYCIKAERTFEVDKSDRVRYRVHCPTENCPWSMHASKMRNSTNVQVKVNPFRHTCLESTLRKETISRAKWVTEDHQVGTKELQKKLKEKFKIEIPYMRVFNGKQHAMDSIYGNWQESFKLLYSFKGEVEKTSPAFGECFNASNDEQNEDPVEATSDDQNDDPIDDPIDEPIDDPVDEPQNDQNDDPIDEPQNDQNDDPIDDQNDDPIYDPIDDPIEEKIEAPNVGVQPSVVVSSTWFEQSCGSEI